MALINESSLPKGQLRKLNSLRKSVGTDIGERAFTEWLASQPPPQPKTDKNAEMIAEALQGLRDSHGLRIKTGGYIVKSGRGRVIVKPAG